MSVLPEVAGCGGCGASVRVNWMPDAIGPGCYFGVVACEKCGLIRRARGRAAPGCPPARLRP